MVRRLATVDTDDGVLQPAFKVPESSLPSWLAEAALKGTYDLAFAATDGIVYDATTGNIISNTVAGVTTTYTYNTNGTVNTETRLGQVRTWIYDGNGNPTSSTVV